MINVTLPDGSVRQFSQATSILDVAKTIGDGLAHATLAGKIDGKLQDAHAFITQDCHLQIITAKDEDGLAVIRHSCAHLLAQAVKILYPETQVTIGPVIEDGFYYDFSRKQPFTPEDLPAIEKKMKALAKEKLVVTRTDMPRGQAIDFFDTMGEHYKAEIIRDIPQDETLSLYTQGEFTDLCRGPHVPHTGHLKHFKLMSLAGAYWRGDANNDMLQRIYGTAWADKHALKDYLHRLEEAEKRDHRKIGKALNLFHLQEEAPGQVFWHEKGWAIWQCVEQYMRDKQKQAGYQEIRTPLMADLSLWEKSGHQAKYANEMFTTHSDNRDYAIKPMSCPCHVQVFNQGLRSYRDLPVRLAEFGCCHRNEPSGALHGLFRVRGFVQDDGHIFCNRDQIQSEVAQFMQQAFAIYQDFGFTEFRIKLATRPDNRIGDDTSWDQAESALAAALHQNDITFVYLPGEGAFYGPKIELHLKDCLGRAWQCGTMQVDFFMPGRLGASYVDEHSNKQIPVMLHRATLGSIERFIGMLIEHHAGRLPTWLSPVQLVIMTIANRHDAYAQKLAQQLQQSGFRTKLDLRNEKIGFKIREHTLQRIPYQLVIGDKELDDNQVAVRLRDGTDLGSIQVEQLLEQLHKDCDNK